MGQTVYKSDFGYRSILLYLFQLNYNYKSAFVMSNTFQRTFQHLVDANTVLQSVIPPLPSLQRAPRQAPSSLPAPALSPPSTTDQEIKIIQGRTYPSKSLLHAGHRYSKDVFNQLVENIPDTVQIDPLLGYFERTWIAGLNGKALLQTWSTATEAKEEIFGEGY